MTLGLRGDPVEAIVFSFDNLYLSLIIILFCFK